MQWFEEATAQQFPHERKQETLVQLAKAQVRTSAPLGSSVTGIVTSSPPPPPLSPPSPSSLSPFPSPPPSHPPPPSPPLPLPLPFYRHLITFLPSGFLTSNGMEGKELRP